MEQAKRDTNAKREMAYQVKPTPEQEAAKQIPLPEILVRLGWTPAPGNANKWQYACTDGSGTLTLKYDRANNTMTDYYYDKRTGEIPADKRDHSMPGMHVMMLYHFTTTNGERDYFQLVSGGKKRAPDGTRWATHYARKALELVKQPLPPTVPTAVAEKLAAGGFTKHVDEAEVRAFLASMTAGSGSVSTNNQARLYLILARGFPEQYAEKLLSSGAVSILDEVPGRRKQEEGYLVFQIRDVNGRKVSVQTYDLRAAMDAYWRGESGKHYYEVGKLENSPFFSTQSPQQIKSAKTILITEGVFDTLALDSIRSREDIAIVTSFGTKNTEKVYTSLRVANPTAKILLALDNDQDGRAAAESIRANHPTDDRLATLLPPKGVKDFSDVIKNDPTPNKVHAKQIVAKGMTGKEIPLLPVEAKPIPEVPLPPFPRNFDEMIAWQNQHSLPINVGPLKEYVRRTDLAKEQKDSVTYFLRKVRGNADEQYVRPFWSARGAITGRTLSKVVNVQGTERELRIPVFNTRGLIEADFSQIDIASLAIVSGDKELQRFIAHDRGGDLYRLIASKVYRSEYPTDMPFRDRYDAITQEQRQSVKEHVNRVLNGGETWHGETDMQRRVREEMEKLFTNQFHKAKELLDTSYDLWKQEKLPLGIDGPIVHYTGEGRGTAISIRIQGGSAQIFERWIDEILPKLADEKLGWVRMTIHDAAYVEPVDFTPATATRIEQIMREGVTSVIERMKLPIPLRIETKTYEPPAVLRRVRYVEPAAPVAGDRNAINRSVATALQSNTLCSPAAEKTPTPITKKTSVSRQEAVMKRYGITWDDLAARR